jgi:hypothetical protein
MKRDPILGQLLELRRKSEQRAFETLLRRHSACRQAEAQVTEAGRKVSAHAVQAREREREMLEKLIGRRISLAELDRFLSGVESLQYEARRLRTSENAAKVMLHRSTEAREAARVEYQRRRRAAAKLDLIVQQHNTNLRRQDLALVEMAEEDHRWSAAAPYDNSSQG